MDFNFFRKNIAKIKPYIPGKSISEISNSGSALEVIKMASNENPLGASVDYLQLAETFKKIHYYPHQDSAPLIQKLSEKFGVSRTQIVLGNGSDEIIQMIAGIFLNPDEEIITSMHTFSVYQFVAYLFDGCVTEVPMSEYRYDLDAILNAISPKTRLIFIANPNNPTGTIITHQDVVTFLSKLPPNIIVVMDEAYAEYVESKDFPKTIELMTTYPNLIMLRTFSKVYGLAGLRLGYGISSPQIVEAMQKIRQPFNLNSVALKAGELALNNPTHIQKSVELNQKEKHFLYKELDKLKLSYIKSEANFICIFLPIAGKDAMDALITQGIIIRPLESFNIQNAIRLTIGTRYQNKRFITALKTVLDTQKET
jgi:histidinol-phosphate aminotransferase